ncbi:MAG: FtsX-like permease family protein [Acidimicrobiia bacterium]
MGAVMLRVRSDLRRRPLQLLVTVLLIGAAGAAVLTAAAGARRTASAITRSARASLASDVSVGPDITGSAPAAWSRVDRLPEVASVTTFKGVIAMPVDAHGAPDARWLGAPIVSFDRRLFRDMDRPRLLAGRLPDPDVAHEIAVNEALARQAHVAAGAHLDLHVFKGSDLNQSGDARPPPAGRPFRVTVTGVYLTRNDALREKDDPALGPSAYWGPAAAKQLAEDLGLYDGKFVRLKRGPQALGSFERHVRELMPGTPFVFQELRTSDARARRTVHPYVIALGLFALITAVVGAAVISQLFGRQRRSTAMDKTALRAIGFERRDFAAIGFVEGALVGSAGAALAVIGAVLASTLMPIGPVRRVEPHPGVSIDWVVLPVGFLLIAGLVALRGAIVMAHVPRREPRRHPALLPATFARAGVATPIVNGVRFATDGGRGDTAVPVRSAVLGIGVALGAVIASLVYAAGLTHFTGTPRLYGWNWNALVAPQSDDPATKARVGALAKDSRVVAQFASYANVEIHGTTVPAVGFDSPPALTIVEGRAPRRSNEVVLGTSSQHLARAALGDRITLRGPAGSLRYHLVGRAVFPRLQPYPASEPTGLGIGAGFSKRGLERLVPRNPDDPLGNWVVVRVRRDARTTAPTVRSLDAQLFHGDPSLGWVLGPQRPIDVTSYDRVSRTPLLLALLLVVLAIGAAAHVLISSVRRRGRDLAVLKTIGFTRRQVSSVVFAQATTLIGVAVVVAVPLGIVTGRWAWTATAHRIGIPVAQRVPVVAIALVVTGAFAIANALAFVPGRRAARIRPAVALRTE